MGPEFSQIELSFEVVNATGMSCGMLLAVFNAC